MNCEFTGPLRIASQACTVVAGIPVTRSPVVSTTAPSVKRAGNEYAVDEVDRRRCKLVDLDAGEDAPLFDLPPARERIDPVAAHAGSQAISAADDIGQVIVLAITPGQPRTKRLPRLADLSIHRLNLVSLPRRQLTVAACTPANTAHSAVIIPLRYRIELVVVAAGAVDRQAARAGDHLRDHVVQIIGPGRAGADSLVVSTCPT